MSQATQDLVIRMKTDSTNFNEGIEKAKGKVKSFKTESEEAGNSTAKSFAVLKGAIGKVAIAIGAATTAWKAYKSMAEQTQYYGDKLNNTFSAFKDTWGSLQREIIAGGNLAVSQIRALYDEAKKLAELRDSLGTDVISQRFYRMKYLTPFNEAVNEYQEAKKNKNEEAMAAALEKATKALNEYRTHSQKLINDSEKTVLSVLKEQGVNTGNKSAMDMMEDVVAAQNGLLSKEAEVFKYYAQLTSKDMTSKEWREEFWKKIWVPQHPTYMTGKYGTAEAPSGIQGAIYSMKYLGYSDAQIKKAENEYRMSQINDKNFTDALDVLETGFNVQNELISLDRRRIRMTESETPINPTIKANNVEIVTQGQQDLIPELKPRGTENTQIQFTPNAAQPLDEDMVANWMAEYELQMLEFHDKWNGIIEKTNAYAAALGNVSTMFSNLASMATDDSPWKRFLTILGSVASGIMSLVQTYTSLVAVESVARAIESGEGIPFPYNLIAIAAAGAAITGIIASIVSQAKSQKFAQGGIVGGNDYHDGIHANLSTGEMVLNKNQQARLWNMIMSGGQTNEKKEITFKIQGSDLVSVIDNYNKIISY